jgi:hypothetical protein
MDIRSPKPFLPHPSRRDANFFFVADGNRSADQLPQQQEDQDFDRHGGAGKNVVSYFTYYVYYLYYTYVFLRNSETNKLTERSPSLSLP